MIKRLQDPQGAKTKNARRKDEFGLPRDLGDGLVLRWATPDDAEELAAFNAHIHADNPDEPAEYLGHWVRDLMRGDHPTTSAGDFTVVVDGNNGGKIVSSLNLISQMWTYDGIKFGCGRPELVGTNPDYRRRGLIRAQFEAVHAKSAARGEMVQAITGIPWYYRLFDYEMALDLGGGRLFFWNRPDNYKPVEQEPYRLRPATVDDIPVLAQLYAAHCAGSLVTRVRDETLWRYEMTGRHKESAYAQNFQMVETTDGVVAGYAQYRHWGQRFDVSELAVLPGHSLRAVSLFLTRALKLEAGELNKERDKPIEYIRFGLGAAHPAYEALGKQLERQRPPYAWYIRLPDLPGFLRHIAPSLEKRLAGSVMAGLSGVTRLNFYRSHMTLQFENGTLVEVGTYEPKQLEDGDALFPDLTFLQLLFGYRSLDELDHARADCYTKNAETAVLLNILFPRQHSWVTGLG